MERARSLAGLSLRDLAHRHGVQMPADLRRKKGWVGELLEKALGAVAGSRPIPDFAHLGIELKSLPVDAQGIPLESTFVCSRELEDFGRGGWRHSRVREKLARVLIVPVQAVPAIPLAKRKIGTPLCWSPTEEQEATLQRDWEDFADLIARDLIDGISARRGEVLQIRPKARDASVRREIPDADGEVYLTLPRGFYLRRTFTTGIVRRAYATAH
jgi:DNA mismatch repair protein MutH